MQRCVTSSQVRSDTRCDITELFVCMLAPYVLLECKVCVQRGRVVMTVHQGSTTQATSLSSHANETHLNVTVANPFDEKGTTKAPPLIVSVVVGASVPTPASAAVWDTEIRP